VRERSLLSRGLHEAPPVPLSRRPMGRGKRQLGVSGRVQRGSLLPRGHVSSKAVIALIFDIFLFSLSRSIVKFFSKSSFSLLCTILRRHRILVKWFKVIICCTDSILSQVSTSSTERECGGATFYCPRGVGEPLNVTLGFYATGGSVTTRTNQVTLLKLL